MIYVLDTCVISEFSKQNPAQEVVDWVVQQSNSDLFVSVLSLGEIEKGISRLPESSKKRLLTAWFQNDFLKRFEYRILNIDAAVALQWGSLSGLLENSGRKLPVVDGLIAATVLVHHGILITRNEVDFEPSGVAMINPWDLEMK